VLTIESPDKDEICLICSKPKESHDSIESNDCSTRLIEMVMLRLCGLCGVTKPSAGVHDRCGKCGEKYSFSNH